MSWWEENYKTEALEDLRDRLDSNEDKEVVDKAISDIKNLVQNLTVISGYGDILREKLSMYKRILGEDE